MRVLSKIILNLLTISSKVNLFKKRLSNAFLDRVKIEFYNVLLKHNKKILTWKQQVKKYFIAACSCTYVKNTYSDSALVPCQCLQIYF